MLRQTRSKSRFLQALIAVTGLVLACGPSALVLLPPTPTATPTPGLAVNLPTSGSPPATSTLAATLQRPQLQPTPTLLATATPQFPWLTGEVRVFPGPLHYSGDLLTVEVSVENIHELQHPADATLAVDGLNPLKVEAFAESSPLRQNVLVFRWAWDTTGLVGMHDLAVTLPIGDSGVAQKLTASVYLKPATDRPVQEVGAKWEVRDAACCRIQFVTHTAAERDVLTLADKANQAVAAVERKLGYPISSKPVLLTFIGNEWGNGAFTQDEVVISYVDRGYLGLDLDTVLRHELTHWALRPLEERTPVILEEGTAVYVSGGHYKPEPLAERGAALVALGDYVPLTELADHFRDIQHETAYIEAGALVEYLSNTYGWGKFLAVYANKDTQNSDSQWLDEVFKQEYRKTLIEVESDFRGWLQRRQPGAQLEDVRLTMALYDTIRRYQELYAPFEVSLPSAKEAITANQTAEYVREASAPENMALEALLASASQDLRAGRYASVSNKVKAIAAVLDKGDFATQPVADYLAIVQALSNAGYEVQRVDLSGDQANVQAIRAWPKIETLSVRRGPHGWQVNTEP